MSVKDILNDLENATIEDVAASQAGRANRQASPSNQVDPVADQEAEAEILRVSVLKDKKPPVMVAGFKCRTLSLSDFAILQLAKCPFLGSVPISSLENPVMDCLRYFALTDYDLTIAQAYELAQDPEAMLERGLELGGEKEFAYTTLDTMKAIVDHISSSNKTRVIPVEDKTTKGASKKHRNEKK